MWTAVCFQSVIISFARKNAFKLLTNVKRSFMQRQWKISLNIRRIPWISHFQLVLGKNNNNNNNNLRSPWSIQIMTKVELKGFKFLKGRQNDVVAKMLVLGSNPSLRTKKLCVTLCGSMERTLDLKSEDPSLSSGSVTYGLCDFGQVTSLVLALGFLIYKIKWGGWTRVTYDPFPL